jgi:hypothetical protein
MDCTWKMSHDDVNQAALYALQRLRMMKCAVIYVEKQISTRVELQIQLEPRWKFIRKNQLAEVLAVDLWFISAPPMRASKEPIMKHAMKVLFRNFVLHI